MKLERTLETGKATIKIKMDYSYNVSDMDGHLKTTKEIVKLVELELWSNGNLVQKTTEGFVYLTDGKTRFGSIYITEATGLEIVKTLEEMHSELSANFNEITPKEEMENLKETTRDLEIKEAKKIMEEVKIRKTTILSVSDEKKWKINYNNINNEGGEGYMPQRATLEDVEMAKKIFLANGMEV